MAQEDDVAKVVTDEKDFIHHRPWTMSPNLTLISLLEEVESALLGSYHLKTSFMICWRNKIQLYTHTHLHITVLLRHTHILPHTINDVSVYDVQMAPKLLQKFLNPEFLIKTIHFDLIYDPRRRFHQVVTTQSDLSSELRGRWRRWWESLMKRVEQDFDLRPLGLTLSAFKL